MHNEEKLKYWIALKSIEGVGNIMFPALVEKFGSPSAVFNASTSQLTEIPGVSNHTAKQISDFKEWDKVTKELEFLFKNNIHIITYQDDPYPEKLLYIYDRPSFLYVSGKLDKEDVNIAVVGSRQCSSYGQYTTEKISRELAYKGITVVSGMARGIDSAAHRGTLAAHGRTIAVLGSGIDVIYPPENKKLYSEIIENGAVISEYPPGTPPRSSNFPARNRIISGMSYGVVIVEAGEKSGSLITARLALEQGREVFSVPGSIDSLGSRGTNKLIKQGAKLVENTDDILEEILPQMNRTKKNDCSKPSFVPEKEPFVPLNEIEQTIMTFMNRGRMHVDELIALSGLSCSDIISALTRLELKGIIRQDPGKFFSIDKKQTR